LVDESPLLAVVLLSWVTLATKCFHNIRASSS